MWSGYESKYSGLCATCKHADICVFRCKRGKDALYCELFEHCALGAGGKGVDMAATGEGDQQLSLGLCATCANAGSCRLARPEAGVWHCEEYA